MILSDFKDFPRGGRLLGIDWGARRIGAAVSSPDRAFVFVRKQIAGANHIRPIINLISDERIVGIVIGLPLYSDGTESDTTNMVRNFATDLAKATDVPIVFVDESFTSHAAACERQVIKNKRQEFNIDSESAKIILENAIAIMERKNG